MGISIPSYKTKKFAPVSVIIPCYNCSASISRAIKSVLSQTILPLEIIIIYDECDDNASTLAIAKTEMALFSEIQLKIMKSIGLGAGTARNIGWESASQKFIAFLDADDSWHVDKLRIQYEFMTQNQEVTMTAHRSRIIIANSTESIPRKIDIVRVISINPYRLIFKNTIPTRSVMIRRDCLNRFMHGKKYCEDLLLWLNVLHGQNNLGYFIEAELCFSYKNDYGASGLTGNLINAELGELDTLKIVYKNKFITMPIYLAAIIFSMLKFVLRIFMTMISKILHTSQRSI